MSRDSSCLAAFSSSGGASLPRFVVNAISARSTSALARCSGASGPACALASKASAASGAPASCWAWAAASARLARWAGSAVKPAARSRKAAADASPPRRLRPTRRPLQRSGHIVVETRRGQRAMPGPAIGIELRIADRCQRLVCTLPFGQRRCLVHR